jgi:hypothetical protein
MTWCFDTSAFIEPWVRLYPPDLFGPVWTKLEEMAEDNAIIAPTDVLLELEKQKDDLHDWARARPGLFLQPDREVMEVFTQIVNDHPDFMKVNSTKSGADPFVVALAEVKKLRVVTYETMAKKEAAPKIPNVCAARRLPETASLIEVLRDGGFRL